jgi:hypothetical protein
MNAPHVTVEVNGDIRIRLSQQDASLLLGPPSESFGLKDRLQEKLFVAYFEAACKSEALA